MLWQLQPLVWAMFIGWIHYTGNYLKKEQCQMEWYMLKALRKKWQKFLKYQEWIFHDRFEVTNKKYKEFVDAGGYRIKKYWKNEFIKEGKSLTWENAVAEFVDKSGRPGPATWEAGDYPNGQDNYPVTGISCMKQQLILIRGKKPAHIRPLVQWYWNLYSCFAFYFNSKILPLSNFYRNGVETVGKFQE